MYVDGFVLCVPKKKLPAYKRLAKKASSLFLGYGALQYCECVGDDLKIKGAFSFLELAKPKKGETVVFSWIAYESRKQRDKANAAMMKDPRMAALMPKDMPFDMKRMAMGGFDVMVEAGAKRR